MYSFNRLVTHLRFLQSSRGGCSPPTTDPPQAGVPPSIGGRSACSIFDCGVSVSVLSVGFWG